MMNVHAFTAKSIDGKETPLENFKGKTLLIVNTASRCGFTPQYKGLEELYQKYKDKGFVVLGFPSNNFLGQEPGTNEEIKKFCDLKYQVTFPMFEKIDVKGENAHALYRYLTKQKGEVTWNFNKFLVDPKGDVVARFDSKVDPLSSELTSKIEEILPSPKA